MATVFNVNDIVTDYGNYYEKTAANKSRIKSAMFQPSETLQTIATRIKTTDTIFKMANPSFQKLIKPFKKEFNAGGGVVFHANEIRLFKQKIDLSLYPDDVEGTWLGFLAGTGNDKENWPLVRWMMEEYMIPQSNEDKEEAVWAGVRDDEGENPVDCYDGLEKQLREGVANTDYPIETISGVGALTETTAFDQIEAFSKGIPSRYTKKKMFYVMSPKMVRAYLENKRDLGLYTITKDDQVSIRVDFTNHVLIGSPSMADSDGIFATLPGNVIHLTKRGEDQARFIVQAKERQVIILTDWWEGFGFACNQLVWTTPETVAVSDSSGGGTSNEDTNNDPPADPDAQ